MRRILALAISVLAVASCADVQGQPSAGPSSRATSDGFRRIAETLGRDRAFTCSDPRCLDIITSWRVPDPPGPGTFQLVATLTLTYRLSAGDSALIGINASCPIADPPVPCPFPSPEMSQPVAPLDGLMTTTLTWTLPPTGGHGSYVYFMLTLRDRSGDGSVAFETRRLTAVFEMWPARAEA
jgi:hypothetical protein